MTIHMHASKQVSASRAEAAPRHASAGRKPASRADATLAKLRNMIVLNVLRPGERLSEPQLSEALGVSRTPVREALRLLAAEGLVALRRNRSAVVTMLDPAEIAGLFEVERGIESFAAALAATRLTEADLRRLEDLQVSMEKHHAAGAREAYIRVNIRVHRRIVAGAKNAVLSETHAMLLGRLQRARNLALGTEGRIEESILEHRAILAALHARDAAAAARLVAHHVNRTGDIVAELCAARLR